MRVIFFLLTLTQCSLTFAQDGRIQMRTKGYLRINQDYISSDRFFGSDLEKISIRTNSIFTTSLTGEYGVTKRLTAGVLFPFFVNTTINSITFRQSGNTLPGKSLRSVGDAEVMLRYGVIVTPEFQAVVTGRVGLPTGVKDQVGTDIDLQTGDGEFNQSIGVYLRYAPITDKLFVSSQVHYNNRTEHFSDEIRFGFDCIFHSSKWMVTGKLFVVESLFNDTAPTSLNGLYSNHQEFVAPSFEALRHLSQNISVYSGITWYADGRNTIAAPAFSIGVQVRR